MLVVLLSGKRASGKDFIAALVEKSLLAEGLGVHRTSLGSVNKRAYAARSGVDLERLEHDRAFKESHRLALVRHHQERNAQDPEWALVSVVTEARDAEILIVSDVRTIADLRWFLARFACITLRIDASDDARRRRGWTPDPVKDALPTEVELDGYEAWSARFQNDVDDAAEPWVRREVVPRVISQARRLRPASWARASGPLWRPPVDDRA